MAPPVSLYVHLPWCERKCPYCDFNSHESHDIPEAEYVDALLADLNCDLPFITDRTIQTIFIGGGTPSLFTGASIDRLLKGIRSTVPVDERAEVTMEVNPGSAEASKFHLFRRAGVNRLSVGVQTFDDVCLQALGRVHDSAQAIAAIAAAHAADFEFINIDLMHGLPQQSTAAALRDLDIALELGAGHLSWYQLTIEPNTVFHSEPPTLPVEGTLADIQHRGERTLRKAGLSRYEVSAWARQNERCRHNLNYWGFGDYLGIGAGAHSKLTSDDGTVLRRTKRRQPDAYLGASPTAFAAGNIAVHPDELAGEFAMNALRLSEGVPQSLLADRIGQSADAFMTVAEELSGRGLLDVTSGMVRATPAGYRFLDSVVAEFFPDS